MNHRVFICPAWDQHLWLWAFCSNAWVSCRHILQKRQDTVVPDMFQNWNITKLEYLIIFHFEFSFLLYNLYFFYTSNKEVVYSCLWSAASPLNPMWSLRKIQLLKSLIVMDHLCCCIDVKAVGTTSNKS